METQQYTKDKMDLQLDKVCEKHLGQPSRFSNYDPDRLVFFSITGKDTFEQEYMGHKRAIVPGEVYPDNAGRAKVLEHALARQKVRMLDMSINVQSFGASMKNAVAGWAE